MSDISIVEIEPQLVIGIRRIGSYELLPEMFPEIFQFAVGNNIEIAGPPIFVMHGTSEEDALRANSEGNADLEVVIPVSEKIGDTGSVKCYELPGGKMAKTIHKGPYEECGPTYQALFAWLAENGFAILGSMREVYLNDPQEIAPEDILTEIYAPVEQVIDL
ncbi:GyrI-like domain-containing protein [Methanococcoides sp.]|uniref:GyrI-like domain-containing protein n=1 Tax=Methanococcoides sp. TaxID=1966350 RepID=UPI00272DFBF1|nr:GyrI-like domain-containing protein [Methanococcoides sp.]